MSISNVISRLRMICTWYHMVLYTGLLDLGYFFRYHVDSFHERGYTPIPYILVLIDVAYKMVSRSYRGVYIVNVSAIYVLYHLNRSIANTVFILMIFVIPNIYRNPSILYVFVCFMLTYTWYAWYYIDCMRNGVNLIEMVIMVYFFIYTSVRFYGDLMRYMNQKRITRGRSPVRPSSTQDPIQLYVR